MEDTRRTRYAAAANTPKDERCRLAGCPLAGRDDPRCAKCTGPISWTDARGRKCAVGGLVHRQCTSCPMDGMGLPVCWAGCEGPSVEYQTDGKSMVTLGGMADADGFIGRRMDADARRRGGAERMFESLAVVLAGAILRMDSRTWTEFSAACERRDSRRAAEMAGVPMGVFRGPDGKWSGSAADVIMKAMGGMSAEQMDVVRGLAEGRSQRAVGEASGGVTKQAVSNRIARLERSHPWVSGLARGGAKKS